ncbi:MAG: HAMP domain-containing protein [Desulfatitalea sp.]|nr:HAMP domain-containing protein [Desulfatitalea sp.]NNK00523.1 HAMP domain-containing protein [Desulfatitalea sp.]
MGFKLNKARLFKSIGALFNRVFIRFQRGRVTRDDLFIGETLKRNNVITEFQLKTALDAQRETLMQKGRAVRLGRIVVELGFADEERIIGAINAEYQIEVTSLNDDIRELLSHKYGTYFEQLPKPRLPMWLQMAAATTFIIVLTIFTLSLVVLNQQKDRLYDQTVLLGMVSLSYFANNAPIPLLEDDILRLNTLIKEASNVKGFRYALIVGPNNRIKAHTDINLIGVPFKHFVDHPTVTEKDGVVYYSYNRPNGERLLDLYRTISFKDKALGQVHVGISLDFIDDLVRRERLSVVVITLTIIVVGLAVAVAYGFRFSRPISHLVRATQEIAQGNYQYRVPVKRNDELGNLGTAFNRMGQELWKNSMTQKSFGKYVGNEVLDMILANPETAWLKGTRNQATILFADVRGFTAFAESHSPEEVVESLNTYLELTTRVIIQYGGYIDKFIGDAVLAVFGVPVYRDDHITRAVRAAMYLQEELHKHSRHGIQLLARIGISIHTGDVVAGNVGSQSKMEYTVIGDSVNLASRLNGFAGPGETVISQKVKDNVDSAVETHALGPQSIKGKAEPVQVYKLLHIHQSRSNANE